MMLSVSPFPTTPSSQQTDDTHTVYKLSTYLSFIYFFFFVCAFSLNLTLCCVLFRRDTQTRGWPHFFFGEENDLAGPYSLDKVLHTFEFFATWSCPDEVEGAFGLSHRGIIGL